jgi:S4 domain protein YaaA
MQKYTLFEEYITLGKVLKELGLIATGGQAKLFLSEHEGQISYNGEAENRRGKKLRDGDTLEFPNFNLSVTFEKATDEAIKEHEADKIEEARVKALVKKLNIENKSQKPKKKQAPRFPGRK